MNQDNYEILEVLATETIVSLPGGKVEMSELMESLFIPDLHGDLLQARFGVGNIEEVFHTIISALESHALEAIESKQKGAA